VTNVEGFALDETHQPHISCLHRYVKTAELDKVYDDAKKKGWTVINTKDDWKRVFAFEK
jgi:hypothetical protein